jgi:hypothetical protein
MENGFSSNEISKVLTQNSNKKIWDDHNLFFGGVHVSRYDIESNFFTGSGDPRRGGAFKIV